MTPSYLALRRIRFSGPGKESVVEFETGVNVICGASDTGKSFLAEAIDFMLGGSELREIPERISYSAIGLDMACTDGSRWRLERATSGGDFELIEGAESPTKLRKTHAHDRTDNVSGFLLNKVGLLGRRILQSSGKGKTNSLSFRNLARLIIVQEGEIQQKGSPFWGGQFTLKTVELATVKLLLTGIDDSAVISTAVDEPDNARQIALLDELLADLSSDITDMGHEKAELEEQLERLDASLSSQRESLSLVQKKMDATIANRRELLSEYNQKDARAEQINDLLARFILLAKHYEVDKQRLAAIQESGSLFVYVEKVPCPLCGALPEDQHIDEQCDGDVASVVEAATAEISKIDQLAIELNDTMADLKEELDDLTRYINDLLERYNEVEENIRLSISPQVEGAQSQFSDIVEKRSTVQNAINMYNRLDRLRQRRAELDDSVEQPEKAKVSAGIPDSAAHQFSMKVEHILRAWNFPGDCRVHFDKESSDFVIDGKPRGSRGKGLRAITHAAISIALLEFCRERSLPHPGFVVMDSPLLAYFKPEGDDDAELQGTDLKERFYEYLNTHHGRDSQIIIIENQHPPTSVEDDLAITVFTGNPSEGRFGLL